MSEKKGTGNEMNLILGDCKEKMKEIESNTFDSIITDPPYELGFMGKKWDSTGIAYDVEVWEEALRILKPGGHLLAFGATRTHHRMMVAIEDAGFEMRDCLMWVYGSGFPKSYNISKAIDKAAGAKREPTGLGSTSCSDFPNKCQGHGDKNGRYSETIHALPTAPSTPKAKQWAGWGTALKPAYEPIVLARKPLIGTIVKNVLTHDVGGMNIDSARFGSFTNTPPSGMVRWNDYRHGNGKYESESTVNVAEGRFPTNLIFDEEAGQILDSQGGTTNSRFFYCAKASKKERNAGIGNNTHPTVKPIKLMEYLVRLITPPNGKVLDPFMGSGSTGGACVNLGFNFTGIELDEESLLISQKRIEHFKNKQLETMGEENE